MHNVNYTIRKIRNRMNRIRLRNKDFSIIASNCNGAFLLHDLGLQFRSPTVNLWFEPKDFIRFLTDLKKYTSAEIDFSESDEDAVGYPVGILCGDVKVYFQHYRTREEARTKWIERCKRINYENLYIMMTDRDGCTHDDMRAFDALPYNNKVIFTNQSHPEIKSAFYIRGFENLQSVGMCFDFSSKWLGKKYYDQFPYISWFNKT